MDEAMGRRTVSGLLVTKGGSILVFREERPRHKATDCCTRPGCSSKIFPNKDRKMHKTANEEAIHQRSQVSRKSNRTPPRANAYDRSTSRTAASTSAVTDNRPRTENAGRDLLACLKERVDASRKRSMTSGSSPNPSSPNTSSSGSLSSGRSISRSICRPVSRMKKDGGRNAETVRMHTSRDSNGNSQNVPTRNTNQEQTSSYQESLDDWNENWHSSADESEEYEDDYVSNDQHREMRMDIDDMSYEELLALGERIGTVSTGLADDALSECLKRSLYVPTTSTSHEDGDINCIICQEEYISGVEVAKMVCNHYYHTTCIQQWLRQKNCCPTCKSVASATSS